MSTLNDSGVKCVSLISRIKLVVINIVILYANAKITTDRVRKLLHDIKINVKNHHDNTIILKLTRLKCDSL